MGEVLEAVLALIGLGALIAGALRPYLGPVHYTEVIDPAAEVLDSIGARHQAADAALRRAAAAPAGTALDDLLRS